MNMKLFTILRRQGWKNPDELHAAAARSKQVGAQMTDEVRWIRTYVVDEGNGAMGTVCIYEATGPEAIRKHAKLADLAVTEILPVADTVLVRPDPTSA
jgi:hypothetical protein